MTDVADRSSDHVHSLADICAFEKWACVAELSALELFLAAIPVAESPHSTAIAQHRCVEAGLSIRHTSIRDSIADCSKFITQVVGEIPTVVVL